jgi:hypothetical protein
MTPQGKIKIIVKAGQMPGTAFETLPFKLIIMKHKNQEETSKHQGTADQNKKNKMQQGAKSESVDSGSQSSKGNREHNSEQGSDGSNWQKGKQEKRK